MGRLCRYLGGDAYVPAVGVSSLNCFPCAPLPPTDGGAWIGLMGAIVRPTNVTGIPAFDLLATDWHHAPAFPTFLLSNPYAERVVVGLDVGAHPVDVYDSVTQGWLARGVSGLVGIGLGVDEAVVVALVPSEAVRVHGLTQAPRGQSIAGVVFEGGTGGQLYVGATVLDYNIKMGS